MFATEAPSRKFRLRLIELTTFQALLFMWAWEVHIIYPEKLTN